MVPHSYLSGTKDKTQKEINTIASQNFEREMAKHKDYYRKHNVYALIYTDSDLCNINKAFNEMIGYLTPEKEFVQLLVNSMDRFFDYS